MPSSLMELTIPNILLAARRHEVAELKRLSRKAQLVGAIGHLIHALQLERGASSIYLASAGQRFADTRLDLIADSRQIAQNLSTAFERQLAAGTFEEARQFYLMAWVLLGIESLPALREQISQRDMSPAQAVAAFSRLIAGLVSLLFEVAHTVLDPVISRSLVALFNFIQGKEHAGQERAVGALSFASGVNDLRHQQRIVHLIEAQERCFQLFDEFATPEARKGLLALSELASNARFDALRCELVTTAAGAELDANVSREWFDCCTERLECMWQVQQFLVGELMARCSQRIEVAEEELQDATGLFASLLSHPPASTCLVDRFFDPDMNIDVALKIQPGEVGAGLGDSMVEVLLAQSARLADVERELAQARRVLDERKVVEKAKGLLMTRRGLSEDAAYKLLRQTAMEQNRRMVDLAAAMLSFEDWVSGLAVGTSTDPQDD